MKKRIIAVLATGIIAVGLVGCGGKPSGMNEHTYKLGQTAVDTLDDYLSGKTTASEAKEELQRVSDRLEELDLEAEEALKNIRVETQVSSAIIGLIAGNSVSDEYDDLKEMLGE